jgi:hypothetical protein
MMPADAAPAPAGMSPPGLRCQVRLPMEPKGWNTVLARCDGSAVAIGLPGGSAIVPGTRAAQYASDMQVIVQALSRPAPGFPAWLAVLCALLGAGALYASINSVARHLPRRAVPAERPERPGRFARFTRRYSAVFHPR